MKKFISMLLVFAMIACMIPAFAVASSAAEPAITLDGDLSDWADTKTVSVTGSGDYEGKSATWYGKLTDEGLYLACDAYHSIFKTDGDAWHTSSNFEFFLRYPNQQQGWVSAKGIDGTTPKDKSNITDSIMVTETVTDHGAATQHTVTEVFISNSIMGNMVYADAIRVGLAWKTPGDDINNNGTGNNGVDNWWCVANPNGDTKSVVTPDGVYTKAEYEALGIEGKNILTPWADIVPAETSVATADEYLAFVKDANYITGCDSNATKGKTLNITADIDFTGKTWAPLNRWVGLIEGNGKTLSGITYENTSRTGSTGLIVNDNANNNANGTVQNLTVADSTLYAPNASEVGAIAGKSDRGRIITCTVEDCEITGKTNVGAVAGRVCWQSDGDYTLVQDCTVKDTTVTAISGAAGGLIGIVSDTKAQLGTYTLDNVTVDGINSFEVVSAGNIEYTEESSATDVTVTTAAGGADLDNVTDNANWTVDGDKYTLNITENGYGNSRFASYVVGNSDGVVTLTADFTFVPQASWGPDLGGDNGFLLAISDRNGDGMITESGDCYYLVEISSYQTDGDGNNVSFVGVERNAGGWGGWAAQTMNGQNGLNLVEGETYTFSVTYDPEAGTIKASVDGVVVLEYTDATPFDGTGYALASKTYGAVIDNVVVEGIQAEEPDTPDTPVTPPTGDMAIVFVVLAVLALGVAVVVTKRRQSAK